MSENKKESLKTKLYKLCAILMIIPISLVAFLLLFDKQNFEVKLNSFRYQKSPGLNPLKGYFPQRGFYDLDYSMEYLGIWLKDIYSISEENGVVERSLNTQFLESLLNDVAERGHCAIIRPMTYYPGNPDNCLYIGDYLYNTLNSAGEIYSNGNIQYPNFDNQTLVDELVSFVTLFGETYDGDARIGFIQLGLYGAWGEWNLGSVKSEHQSLVQMSTENLERIVKAYDDNFNITPLLARNPTMGNVKNYNVGFHDDNYLFNSSDYQSKEWNRRISEISPSYIGLKQFKDFMDATNTHDKWRTVPYGAEISGVIYSKNGSNEFVFESVYEGETFEVFKYCQNMFHTSFISGTGPNAPRKSDESRANDYANLMETARLMGYEIGIKNVKQRTRSNKLKITVTLKNYGCAPFYYNWDFSLHFANGNPEDTRTLTNTTAKLTRLLPGQTLDVAFAITASKLKKDMDRIGFEINNPLKKTSPNAVELVLANNNRIGGINVIGNVKVV